MNVDTVGLGQFGNQFIERDLTFGCGATLLVNMRDIEPRKEDDGFDGAFLSP